jgi:hypothetical protein
VDVVPVRPSDVDRELIAQLKARVGLSLAAAAYLVLVRLKVAPAATAQGWALYVGDFRIPKYWEYKDGIYFKVVDPQFFDDHLGEPLRFSQDGTNFVDTGLKLVRPKSAKARSHATGALPHEDDFLK